MRNGSGCTSVRIERSSIRIVISNACGSFGAIRDATTLPQSLRVQAAAAAFDGGVVDAVGDGVPDAAVATAGGGARRGTGVRAAAVDATWTSGFVAGAGVGVTVGVPGAGPDGRSTAGDASAIGGATGPSDLAAGGPSAGEASAAAVVATGGGGGVDGSGAVTGGAPGGAAGTDEEAAAGDAVGDTAGDAAGDTAGDAAGEGAGATGVDVFAAAIARSDASVPA